jgi:hypothetical protein
MPRDQYNAETADSAWRSLYRVGGTAALTIVAIALVQMIAFILWPPPGFEADVGTVTGYFTLLQDDMLLGLLHLDLLLLVDYVLLVLMFLALYIVLRQVSQSFMAIAMALVFVGIATYFPSNIAFSMLSLSDQYAATTTDTQRTMLLASGQALLTSLQSSTFYVSYILMSAAGLIISSVMLRSNNNIFFSKLTAYVGILASVLGLGLFVPTIGLLLSLISLIPTLMWYILLARRLFRLS